MPVTPNAPTITCDCCGYVVGTGAYLSIFRNKADGTSQNMVFCSTKLCDTKILASLNTDQTSQVNSHVALIVAGVIPNHP